MLTAKRQVNERVVYVVARKAGRTMQSTCLNIILPGDWRQVTVLKILSGDFKASNVALAAWKSAALIHANVCLWRPMRCEYLGRFADPTREDSNGSLVTGATSGYRRALEGPTANGTTRGLVFGVSLWSFMAARICRRAYEAQECKVSFAMQRGRSNSTENDAIWVHVECAGNWQRKGVLWEHGLECLTRRTHAMLLRSAWDIPRGAIPPKGLNSDTFMCKTGQESNRAVSIQECCGITLPAT